MILRCSQGWEMLLIKRSKEEYNTKCYAGRNPRAGDCVWRWWNCTAVSSWPEFSAASPSSTNSASPVAPLPPASFLPWHSGIPFLSTSSSLEWNPGHILSSAGHIHWTRERFAFTPFPCHGALVKLMNYRARLLVSPATNKRSVHWPWAVGISMSHRLCWTQRQRENMSQGKVHHAGGPKRLAVALPATNPCFHRFA